VIAQERAERKDAIFRWLYMEEHGISYDWLFCGDLKSLRRMMHKRKIASAMAPLREHLRERAIRRFIEKYRQLSI
jgi:hypothetical protein